MVAARLLALILPAVVTALEPVVLSDADAKKERDYIRREPACARAGDGAATTPTPKVLHQIWWQGEASIPEEVNPLRATWAATYPTWTIKLWDEAAATKLINTSYAWFAPTFHALPSKIQKADAARYAILHAEGGVYADMDIEAFMPMDDVLAPRGKHDTAHLFEEPATHWDAHDTVISNGMMAAPPAHPLLLAVLRSIRPVAAVFSSSGSHMVQNALSRCDAEEDEAQEAGRTGAPPCGCYVTHSSLEFFPMHEVMRQPVEFMRVGEHTDAARAFIEDLGSGAWPPASAYTAQHFTRSWIDAERSSFWLRGLTAARINATEEAEKLLLATIWSKWGHKYKYNNNPGEPDNERAKQAYRRALDWHPTYGFAHYELGNIELEESGADEAESKASKEHLQKAVHHFTTASNLAPDNILFVNNLGVALINQGKPKEAMPHFTKVLELHYKGSFIAIKGLDPKAGAHLNLGHALTLIGGHRDEAHNHWLEALSDGNYEHSVQAVQRLVADEAADKLPPAPLLDLQFGKALAKEGRTRDAALRFSAAYVGATNLTETEPEVAEAVRSAVRSHMQSLSEVWDEAEGALADAPQQRPGASAAGGGSDKVHVVETGADGTTKRMQMTQEEMTKHVKAGQGAPKKK